MLPKVKSSYILSVILSSLEERKKLKWARYNKKLQENMNRSLINYIIFSGRYIIYERGGNGKEYDNHSDRLIYKGEFFQEKRQGKGEEYSKNGYLIFEGKYFNGKRHGYGKEYDNEGKLIFEREYRNGKRNGNGNILIII